MGGEHQESRYVSSLIRKLQGIWWQLLLACWEFSASDRFCVIHVQPFGICGRTPRLNTPLHPVNQHTRRARERYFPYSPGLHVGLPTYPLTIIHIYVHRASTRLLLSVYLCNPRAEE